MEIAEGQPAVLKTAPRKSESRKREERGRGSESSGATGSREESFSRQMPLKLKRHAGNMAMAFTKETRNMKSRSASE